MILFITFTCNPCQPTYYGKFGGTAPQHPQMWLGRHGRVTNILNLSVRSLLQNIYVINKCFVTGEFPPRNHSI